MSTPTFNAVLPPATASELALLRKAFFEFVLKGVVAGVSGPVEPCQRWAAVAAKGDARHGWASLELRFENKARITLIIEQLGTRCRISFIMPSLCPYILFRKATVSEPVPLMQSCERTSLRWIDDNPTHCYEYEAPMLLHSVQHQETLQMYLVDAVTRLAELAFLCVDGDQPEGSSAKKGGQIIHVNALPVMD